MRKVLAMIFLSFVLVLIGCSQADYETSVGDWERIELKTKTTTNMQTLGDDDSNSDEYFDSYIFDLEHSSGDINVSTWDEESIGIRITKTAYGKNPKVILEKSGFNYNWRENGNDNELEVETLIPDDLDYDEDVKIEFSIMFPQGRRIDLHAESSEGDINISKIIGNVEAHTSNGNIKMKDIETEEILYVETSNGNIDIEDIIAKKVEVHTSNGNIKAKNISNNLVAETSNGSITADTVEGILEAKNSDGAISLTNITLSDFANIHGSEGDIYLEISEVQNGKYEVESSDGNIDILFPEDIKLEFEIIGNEGNFKSNFLNDISEKGDDFTISYPNNVEDLADFLVKTNGKINLDMVQEQNL